MNDRAYAGDVPQIYDRELGCVMFQPYAEEAAQRAAALNPADVLEIAAGSGIVTRELRNRIPAAAKLTASDISEDMLSVARTKIREGEQVRFEIADACALPFADASFDAVVCMFGYMFFPDKPKAMCEAFRALRPAGRYILGVWDSEENNPFARLALALLKSTFPDNPPTWMKQPVSCGAIDPIKESLVDSGFVNISISVVKHSRAFDANNYARGLVFGSPIIQEVEERGGDPEAIAKAYAETLTRAFGSTLPFQAILFEAERPAGQRMSSRGA
ncbi:class I SAM-dependent methyltransferase [Methylocystis heyeri]|uniref:Methyltransferase domain-containing protein n=1 Tax=Methylocystis heyeri TaxID=391905 RepID=A0A6B8KFZ6_9HYPH|nr:class I SAM-dependent methyltransferase [Methylocystis heyeri]QGM45360.1 methyltransferase domain-containing protein [Methylocystis heyeri]